MKKMLFGLIATVMISFSGFANTSKAIKLENNPNVITTPVNKLEIKFDLGNVTNLTNEKIDRFCENYLKNLSNSNIVFDECSYTLSAEVSIGIGKITVSCTYTASTCKAALIGAKSGLQTAIDDVKKMM